MYGNKSKSQQSMPPGVPVAYYETCKHIEQLAALGMPQVTPYTPAPKPHITTMPVPPKVCDSANISSVASPVPSDGSFSTAAASGTLTPRLTGRRKQEMDKFDLEGAYAALIKRLGQRVEEEEEEGK